MDAPEECGREGRSSAHPSPSRHQVNGDRGGEEHRPVSFAQVESTLHLIIQ